MNRVISTFILAMLVSMSFWALMPVSDAKDTPFCDRRDVYNVVVIGTRTHMQKYLKAPSTARFGVIKPIQIDTCEFNIKSHVDAQNSFGAMVRSNFDITFKFEPDGSNVRITNLEWY